MEKKRELKSCPFCGGGAHTDYDEYHDDKYIVRCNDCAVEIRSDDSIWFAIESWNDRPKEVILEEEIAALKKYASSGDEEISKQNELVQVFYSFVIYKNGVAQSYGSASMTGERDNLWNAAIADIQEKNNCEREQIHLVSFNTL